MTYDDEHMFRLLRAIFKSTTTPFIPLSVLRQADNLFQIECDLALPLSISSILSFSYGHPLDALVFFLVFQSYLHSKISFKIVVSEDSSRARWPVKLAFHLFITWRIFLPPLIPSQKISDINTGTATKCNAPWCPFLPPLSSKNATDHF